MLKSEKNVYITETEINPNKYAFLVLCVALVAILFSWILNEIGIFHVGALPMRIGAAISFTSVLIPTVLLRINKENYANPKMKYIIMCSLIIFTTANTTLMTFHTTIMLIFPISIAMLYRSKTLGKIAFFGSLFATIVSPVLGYVIRVWDVDFLRELILIDSGVMVEIVNPSDAITLIAIKKILLYIVFPRLMLVGAYSVLMFYVIRIGVDHVENQIKLNNISHKDAMTGLYNNNYYKEVISTHYDIEKVGVIFFDVNDLKKLNDLYGHEHGDLLLKRSAESILRLCDDDNIIAFRLGGDEFLMLMEEAGEQDVMQMLARWRESIDEINEENRELYDGLECSMAYGYSFGKWSKVVDLVAEADNYMYAYKRKMKAEREAAE